MRWDRLPATHPSLQRVSDPFCKYIGLEACNDPQILDRAREGVETSRLQVAGYTGEIYEVIQKARPQFQAHGYLVSIKNMSRTAGYTPLLLTCGHQVTAGNDLMVKPAEKATGDSHQHPNRTSSGSIISHFASWLSSLFYPEING